MADSVKMIWRNIRVFSIAILVISIVLLLAALIIHEAMPPKNPELNEHRTWILAGLSLMTFFLLLRGRTQFRQQIVLARDKAATVAEKLHYYRTGTIQYMAMSEFSVCLSAILFILTGDFAYLVFSAIIVGFMAANMPRKNKAGELLQLDTNQLTGLDN